MNRRDLVDVRSAGLLLLAVSLVAALAWIGYRETECRWFVRTHLAVCPGDDEAGALSKLGRPVQSLQSGRDDLSAFYHLEAQRRVPTVPNWQRAHVYKHLWYMLVVFVDSAGRVLCVASSAT